MNTNTSCAKSGVLPTIYIISDSVGLTAQGVARAAAAQFGVTNPTIEVFPKVRTFKEIETFISSHRPACINADGTGQMLIFYTLVDRVLAQKLAEHAAKDGRVTAIDLMSTVLEAISEATGLKPSVVPGGMHVADQHYFKRIEAMEFTIAHDDGRNPQDLTRADIVLLGVSRSSKTPTAIYLSQQGYKVANIPVDPSTDPPAELLNVDRTRLFGLMTTPEVLIGIRQRRLGRATAIAPRYADPEYVYDDLEKARALMRKLGCIVVHTENRAVEEIVQEILRYYERVHPSSTDRDGLNQ